MNHSVFKAVFSGIVGILLVVGFLLSPPIAEPAYAQSDDALTAIVDAAKASGARVVIIDPGADTAAADTPARSSRDILLDARAEFIRILGRVGELPGAISAAITSQETTEGQSGWIFLAVLAAVLYLAIGYLGEHYFRAWARRRFLNLFRATPENRAERIGYLIVRAILMLFGAAITTAIALTLSGVLDHSNAVVGELQRILIVFVFLARAVLILIFNLTAPDAASHRSVAMTDDEAQRIYRWAIVAFSIIAVVIIFGRWMEVLGIDPDFKKLILLCSILIAAATFVVLAVANRRAVASALVSGVPDAELSITGRLFSNNWHVLLIVYVATALFVSIVRLLLDQPSALGLVTSPLLIILGGFGLYGVGLMLVDRYFDRKGTRISTEPEASEHEHAAIAESAEAQAYSEVETLDDEVDAVGDDDIGETVEIVRGPVRPGTEAAAETPSASQSPFKQLAEYGVALIVTILCVLAIGGLWGFRETAVGAHANLLFDIGIILFIAYLAWKAVKTAIDVKLAEEAPGAGGHGGGEPGGTGTSRIATLLPLARSVLLITIMAMTAMLVLSELGVEIGPLLAGAGVIGLAVGFGA
ncbi:MAG: hypothetical protein KDJ16_18030, partial [Hyphomicrobiales bacterium]|nr:hypothetical protein [Hyphomicrobiales bacterium]